jgi:hypothetical protein
MCGTKASNSNCPFAFTHESEYAQNMGCLPSQFEIINMRVKHDKHGLVMLNQLNLV